MSDPIPSELVERLLALPADGDVPDDLQSEVRLRFNTARGDMMSGDGGATIASPGHGIDLMLAVSALEAAPAGYVLVPSYVLDEAQFLCDRLDELDWSMGMDEFANMHSAHVDPSHSRLKGALAELSTAPSPSPVARVPDREEIARALCRFDGHDPDGGPKSGFGYIDYLDRADAMLALPAFQAVASREQGPPCENCGKPVEVGQLVLPWDDVGEMHVNCEQPFSLDYQRADDEPEPVVLLGDPMLHVPLALFTASPSSSSETSGDDVGGGR
jgi:hypothetical protein